mgnify:CR=1 FL=1
MVSRRAAFCFAVLVLGAAACLLAPPALAVTKLEALARYRAQMERVHPPGRFVVEYAETRSGPTRVVTETHRLYRNDAGDERNETIAVNGSPLVPAFVRVFQRDAWPYDVTQFLVSADAYDAKYVGTVIVDGRRAYEYAVTAKSQVSFAVTALYVDVIRYLPIKETFDVSGTACAGHGAVDFGPADKFWMPIVVSAKCSVAGQDVPAAGAAQPSARTGYSQTIRFSNYRFPSALPTDIFAAPTTGK